MSTKRGGTGTYNTRVHATSPTSINNIVELYSQGRQIFSTRSAKACEVIKPGSRNSTWLWTLNYPLEPLSADAISFVRQLAKVIALGIPMPRIDAYGIDENGTAFIGLDPILAHPVTRSGFQPQDLQNYFIGMCEIVGELHSNNIVLGNISEDSFLVENGDILLGFPSSANSKLENASGLKSNPRLQSYTSPEQRARQAPTKVSDIYSLGVYLYRLISLEDFIITDDEKSHSDFLANKLPQIVTQAGEQAPTWSLEVLQKCLPRRTVDRIETADELLFLIERRTNGAVSGRRKAINNAVAQQNLLSGKGDSILTQINNFYFLLFGLILVGSLVLVGAASLWARQDTSTENTVFHSPRRKKPKTAAKIKAKPQKRRKEVWTPPRFTPSPTADRYSAARQKTLGSSKPAPFVESTAEKKPSKALGKEELPYKGFDSNIEGKKVTDRKDGRGEGKIEDAVDSNDFYFGPGANLENQEAVKAIRTDKEELVEKGERETKDSSYFGPGPQMDKGEDPDIGELYGDLPLDTKQ